MWCQTNLPVGIKYSVFGQGLCALNVLSSWDRWNMTCHYPSGNQREGNKEGPSRHWACPHTHAHNCILTGRLMSTALSYGHRLDKWLNISQRPHRLSFLWSRTLSQHKQNKSFILMPLSPINTFLTCSYYTGKKATEGFLILAFFP